MDLDLISTELTTNYTSYIHLLKYLLPHLLSSGSPTSLIFISSGLALIPVPRVAGYCASKAALHHLILCIREQLCDTSVKITEIVPPAVHTELHDEKNQPELKGEPKIGMDLDEFTEKAWEGLVEGKIDIPVGMAAKAYEVFEEKRQGMFRGLMDMMKVSGKS
jgi:short-subunit dehydrogenase involved in D-alanine esterification of teichoic acids